MEKESLENVILVSVKKGKKNNVTVLQHVPKDKAKGLLKQCKECFGCGGSMGEDALKDAIVLQGEHVSNLKKNSATLFEGFEVRFVDGK